MISLIALILDDTPRDKVNKTHPPHTIWQTPGMQWAATDEWGVVRYYNTREDAWKFANNAGKESPHPGRPEWKKRRGKRAEKVTDDRSDRD
jgi:hypothetical protein